MMMGFANPNRPICADCEQEFSESRMSLDSPGYCLLCATFRLTEIEAEIARERARDFQAQSREWFERRAFVAPGPRKVAPKFRYFVSWGRGRQEFAHVATFPLALALYVLHCHEEGGAGIQGEDAALDMDGEGLTDEERNAIDDLEFEERTQCA